MPETYSLPTEPEGIVDTMIERFNSGKIDAMMSLFEEKAVFIAPDGTTVTNRTEIAGYLGRTLGLGLPMKARARQMFVADGIAEMVLDWSIEGIGPDGRQVHLSGSAADVLRRGRDGFWRVLIDNNQGTAVRRPF